MKISLLSKAILGLVCCLVLNTSYAHVNPQKAQVNSTPGKIQLVALKRADAPYLVTTLGHRSFKRYQVINQYSYVRLDRSYHPGHTVASYTVNTVRPFIDYQGSRAY